MDRDHALCRRCKHIIRLDWHECAHCGVRSPAPRTLRGTITAAVAWAVVLAAAGAWWASSNADIAGRIANLARRAVQLEQGATGALHAGPAGSSTAGGGAGAVTGTADRTAWGAAPAEAGGGASYLGHAPAATPARDDGAPRSSVRESLRALWRNTRSGHDGDTARSLDTEPPPAGCSSPPCAGVAAETVRIRPTLVPPP